MFERKLFCNPIRMFIRQIFTSPLCAVMSYVVTILILHHKANLLSIATAASLPQ